MMTKTWTTRLLSGASVFLLGAAMTFAFAPYDIFPLALLAPALLLAFLINLSAKNGFWLGFVFGLGFFGAGVYWVFISIHDVAAVPIPLASLITGGLIVALAFFPAMVCYATNRYFPSNTPSKYVCAFPAIWVFSEWVRSWLFTGFPWLFLGYSQLNSPLKGYAPLLSVYGVSLTVLLTSALLLHVFLSYKQKNYRSIYFSLFAIISLWTAGSLFSLIPWTTAAEKTPLSFNLVQGNVPQSIKWSPEHLTLSLERYKELSAPLWGKNKVIIWPEAAVPLSLQDASDYIQALAEKTKATDSHLILGIPVQTEDKQGYYNAILMLNGNDQQFYYKRQLVPFGEYTPLSQIFSNLFAFMHIPMSNLVAGDYNQAPFTLGKIKIFPAICYEIAYPELINFRDKNINLVLTLTNDAWFGQSNARAQHLQIAQMRALELARPLVFVSNDGITAIIGPKGNLLATAPQHEIATLQGEAEPMYGLTPWMRNGMDPILFIMLCLLITAIRAEKKQFYAAKEKRTLDSLSPPLNS